MWYALAGLAVGWVLRALYGVMTDQCHDRTHGPDAYLTALNDAADAVQGMIQCDDCAGCEALDYAVVEIAGLIADTVQRNRKPDA